MFTHLIVENIALVDRLELEFDAGMSVITGETGAGKSIMLDALGLALGDRADSSLIAGNADKGEVHAGFDVSDNEAARVWLAERELLSDGNECILRRIVTRDGRSRGFINGAPATAGDMKMLGDMLIDIHSQHEHQSLLKRDTHRRLLDEFANLGADAERVRQLYEAWQETKRALDARVAAGEEQSSRLQLLRYQSAELDALGAGEGEAQSLSAEQKLLANAESLLLACNEAIALCNGDDSVSALDQVSHAISLLTAIDVEPLRPIIEVLESSRIQLQEAIHDITRFADNVDLNPARLKEVESRLGDLYEIARKHRIDVADIPSLAARIGEELASLEHIDDEIEKLEVRLDQLQDEYFSMARQLGQKRRKAARRVEERVTAQLGRLGMKGAVFEVSLTDRDADQPAPTGMEDIEFLISTNPGQAPRSLNRIASGGELSRISLAIQVVAADRSRVPTLVFDEVDVGIGGAVAEVVGSLLRLLGEKAQIICVTHLPQVAAQGNHHFLVTKTSGKQKAITSIAPLSEENKVVEIARMLGGIEMTDESLAHAREMFRAAQSAGGG